MTTEDAGLTDRERHAQGMEVRRAVLSDAHVDAATASATEFTAPWQDFITRVAWGEVWSRPGLDRRSRSIAVLSSLIAHGHHEELAMHVRAARRNGLTVDEIREVILQSAIYSGVPAANAAFRIAQEALADDAAADGAAEP
jgi:3-oxoadipate enol-lactonase/4-carboxymuconolactone decarboxylase